MGHPLTSEERTFIQDRRIIAAILSIIPGLGHLYKGHYGAGIMILFVGVPVMIWVALLLSFATLGFSLILPFVAWGWVIADAYAEKDWRYPWDE